MCIVNDQKADDIKIFEMNGKPRKEMGDGCDVLEMTSPLHML